MLIVSFTLALLSIAGMALTFFAMCIVCDEHLVPAIEVFIEQFNIPEDVAGVTLIAFGSAAPELLLNILSGAEGTSDLSLSALLGSSIIAFGLIPPLCIIMTPHKEIELFTWPIVREVTFYLIGLITFLVVVQDGELSVAEATTSCAIYGVYVLFVILSFVWNIYSCRNGESEDSSTGLLLERLEMSNKSLNENDHSFAPSTLNSRIANGSVAHRSAKSNTFKPHTSSDTTDGVSNPGATSSSSSSSFGDRVENGAYNDDSLSSSTAAIHGEEEGESTSGGQDAESSPSHGKDSGNIRSTFELLGEDVEAVIRVPKGLKEVTTHYMRTCWAGVWQRIGPQVIAVWNSVTAPISLVVKMTIPSLYTSGLIIDADIGNKHEGQKVTFIRACGTLVMSIFWIAMLAWCIIGISESLIEHMDVGTSTVGATLVALGSEIPDTIASIALARSGFFDGAMAGAIGSQVINITLGVGFPILLSTWLRGTPTKINNQETRSLWLLTGLLALVICGYIYITLPITTIWRTLTCKPQKYTYMKRLGAWQLLCLLLVVTVSFVWLNEEVMDDITDDLDLASPIPMISE